MVLLWLFFFSSKEVSLCSLTFSPVLLNIKSCTSVSQLWQLKIKVEGDWAGRCGNKNVALLSPFAMFYFPMVFASLLICLCTILCACEKLGEILIAYCHPQVLSGNCQMWNTPALPEVCEPALLSIPITFRWLFPSQFSLLLAQIQRVAHTEQD